jgi:uncharacterized protein YhbP (UPF0306 family)
MEVGELIKEYLRQGRMMQIATSTDGQPWICTVYFVPDEKQNLYWLSYPERRHSQEIAQNSKVAIAIPIKFDSRPIIGIQTEGSAEKIKDADVIKGILPAYVEKYGQGKDFYSLFIAGKNRHELYKYTPTKYALMDETNFSDENAHEWIP